MILVVHPIVWAIPIMDWFTGKTRDRTQPFFFMGKSMENPGAETLAGRPTGCRWCLSGLWRLSTSTQPGDAW